MLNKYLKTWKIFISLFILFYSCNSEKIELSTVSYTQFELFVNETGYITDAERYDWSIVQTDVYNYKTVKHANWRKPNGIDTVISGKLPVTQVSYNDALAYCKWANKRLPSYDEYWCIVKNDIRVIVSDNKLPISNVEDVNLVGNVWDITQNENLDAIRLAGGSLFCSKNTCHGTIKDRELFVDKETGNIHIGFSVIDL